MLRRLTFILIVSGALNIFLLAFFFYWMVREKPPTPYFQMKLAESPKQMIPIVAEPINEEHILAFKNMPLESLIAKLTNYSERDLALACLVAFHHFDLDRALKGQATPEQKKMVSYQSGELMIYPGLTEEQFKAILTFAQTERWPLTSQGLFLVWQQKKDKEGDPSLVEAFYLTPEFLAVETLFKRTGIQIEKRRLLQLLSEGKWEMLHHFMEQQRESQDLSLERQQRFLADYIEAGSKTALTLVAVPESVVLEPVVSEVPVVVVSKPIPKKDQVYIVQEGDSLWKISRKHKVNLEMLKKHNQLKTDKLKPGTVLKIP